MTTVASTVLLKMGHSDKDLNIGWIQGFLDGLDKTKRYYDTVSLFCAYCLGQLSLSYSQRKDKKEILNLSRELLEGLSKLDWMNNPKSVAFLTILISEIDRTSEANSRELTSRIENYLTDYIEQNTSNLENLTYALFSLSLLNPEVVKDFIIDHQEIASRLTSHGRIELRALALNVLDNAGIPCAEETYQGLWSFFGERRYGIAERSIIQRLVSSFYSRISGLPFDQPDIRLREKDEEMQIEMTIPISDVEKMVAQTPPIDQLSMIALSILWSNYDQLYLFSRRRFKEYTKLVRLELKDKYVPVDNESISKVSKTVFRYEIGKILVKYGMLTLFALGILPSITSYLMGIVTTIPSPWSNALGTAIGLFIGGTSFLKWIFSSAKTEYSQLRKKSEKLRREGEWADS
ncbi:MAG: hypothetical protein OEZ48_07530 [Candidatus Bathyarchaeota archaeon]|nr:hypothetical protein [Candidatus Bathyarchaeota archaeon]